MKKFVDNFMFLVVVSIVSTTHTLAQSESEPWNSKVWDYARTTLPGVSQLPHLILERHRKMTLRSRSFEKVATEEPTLDSKMVHTSSHLEILWLPHQGLEIIVPVFITERLKRPWDMNSGSRTTYLKGHRFVYLGRLAYRYYEKFPATLATALLAYSQLFHLESSSDKLLKSL